MKLSLTCSESFILKYKNGDNIENFKARTIRINNVLDKFMEIQKKL